MARPPQLFPMKMVDTSYLSDADWVRIDKLKRGWEAGGPEGLKRAIAELFKDPITATRIMAAFYPERVAETIKDEMAKVGTTKEESEELMRKLQRPASRY
jgi:hypothetical protein